MRCILLEWTAYPAPADCRSLELPAPCNLQPFQPLSKGTPLQSPLCHTLDDMLPSPMDSGPMQSQQLQHSASLGPEQQTGFSAMFSKFSELLDHGLTNTATKITNDIKADFQSLCSRMEAIEHKFDSTVTRTNQTVFKTFRIRKLYNNFRIRGLPEMLKDVPDAV